MTCPDAPAMTGRRRLLGAAGLGLGGLCAAGLPARGRGQDLSQPLAHAREAFRRAIALSHGVDPAQITVQPRQPGLPGNPYEALTTGPFFALRADFPGRDPGPTGFAAADGRTVFARGGHGIEAFLWACGLWGGQPLPAEAIARRMLWIFQPGPGVRLISAHPGLEAVSPPLIEGPRPDGAVVLTYFITRTAGTGGLLAKRVRLTVAPGRQASLEEARLP